MAHGTPWPDYVPLPSLSAPPSAGHPPATCTRHMQASLIQWASAEQPQAPWSPRVHNGEHLSLVSLPESYDIGRISSPWLHFFLWWPGCSICWIVAHHHRSCPCAISLSGWGLGAGHMCDCGPPAPKILASWPTGLEITLTRASVATLWSRHRLQAIISTMSSLIQYGWAVSNLPNHLHALPAPSRLWLGYAYPPLHNRCIRKVWAGRI